MFTKNIIFQNFIVKNNKKKIKQNLKYILNNKNTVIESLSTNYKDSFIKQKINKFKKSNSFRIIGMGGSTLGAQAIYDFLKEKINKNFAFIDNLQNIQKKNLKKKFTNLIISKSGNTTETIVNLNIILKKKIKTYLSRRIKKIIWIF